MKKLVWLLLAVMLACTGGTALGNELDDLFSSAAVLMVNGQYGEALEIYLKLGQYEDSWKYAMYCRGMQAGREGNYTLAVTCFQ